MALGRLMQPRKWLCFTGTGLAVSASCQLEPLLEATVILLGVAGSTVVLLRHSPPVIN